MTSEAIIDVTCHRGDRGAGVRRVQEWLCLHECHVAIDSVFGPATEASVAEFQGREGLQQTGIVDPTTWDALMAPMTRATSRLGIAHIEVGTAIVDYAAQHLAEHPREIGGQNAGPWVRLYMDGHEGPKWPWCAGAACFIAGQAYREREQAMPITPSFSCDTLAINAKQRRRFIDGNERGRPLPAPGDLFLCRRTPGDWTHTGIVVAVHIDYFEGIEGNTNDDGDREGYELCRRRRGYVGKDFIRCGPI